MVKQLLLATPIWFYCLCFGKYLQVIKIIKAPTNYTAESGIQKRQFDRHSRSHGLKSQLDV